jgi:hypothetical protein
MDHYLQDNITFLLYMYLGFHCWDIPENSHLALSTHASSLALCSKDMLIMKGILLKRKKIFVCISSSVHAVFLKVRTSTLLWMHYKRCNRLEGRAVYFENKLHLFHTCGSIQQNFLKDYI